MSTASQPADLELRVLAGPQAGAGIALAADVDIHVGSFGSPGCQVVLRDPQVGRQRLRLRLRAHDALIKVCSGVVDMDGQVLTGPCAARWRYFAPLRIGGSVIAIGERGSAAWANAQARALQPAGEAALATEAAQPAAEQAAAAPAPHAPKRRIDTWLAMGGGAVTAVGLLLVALISVATPAQGERRSDRERLAQVLLTHQFRGLRIETAPDGALQLRGELHTLADRALLDRALVEARIYPAINLRIGEEVAAAVANVFRMNGIAAEAHAVTASPVVGAVRVKTREADLARLAEVEMLAQRDVPGLAALSVENVPPPHVPAATPVVHDAGKRIASIVSGESPYVVTVDGTRYFVGALLPTGHRLMAINDQQVLLSKDGAVSPLRF